MEYNDLTKVKLRELLESITDSRGAVMLQIYNDNKDLFHFAAGSSHNHQAWEGGYADHIAEILRINIVLYDSLNALRLLNFSKDSAAIVLFLHDAEKPFRYGPKDDGRCHPWREKAVSGVDWEQLKHEIIAKWQEEYGFSLFDDEYNALIYTHGEGDDYRKDKRVACPLAAYVHHCDNTSARIYYNDGQFLS